MLSSPRGALPGRAGGSARPPAPDPLEFGELHVIGYRTTDSRFAFQDARVVVTGAAGFLGSHLCDALLREGGVVVAVENFLTGE